MRVTRSCGRRVVSELSRLGRSPGRIVAILDVLAKAGIAFVAIKENIRIEGKPDTQTRVMTRLFALFAGVERDLISGRTRDGLARAKSSGTKLGAQKGRCASHALTARRQRPALPMLLSRFRSPRPAARLSKNWPWLAFLLRGSRPGRGVLPSPGQRWSIPHPQP